MKKLLKHYLIEKRPKGDDIHLFIYEIVDKPIKKQQIKEELASIVAEKIKENKK